MRKLLTLGLLFLCSVLLGQDIKQVEKEQKAADLFRMQRVESSLHLKRYIKDNNTYELYDVQNGTPIYLQTYNTDAARSTRTNLVNNMGLNGEGETLYIWDSGLVRLTHQEFQGRVLSGELSLVAATNHATHVGGTMVAAGINPSAKGMSSKANLISYDWNSDNAEATQAVQQGMLISNHSYGFSPSSVPVLWFGSYQNRARDWDNILFSSPYYLQVVAAGNDGMGTSNTSPLDPTKPQYDKLTGMATAKNNLVVAATEDALVDGNGNLISVQITNFSSQGPTDDLRIKPDIAGNGRGLFSAGSASDTNYSTLSGTSMASPNVAGSLALIQQHARSILGGPMRASTLKGLVLHTADDAGIQGPDANFGWGLLNTKRAVDVITNNNTSSLIREQILTNGGSYTTVVTASGIEDLKVSISWTDPAGNTTNILNDPSPRLIRDLDVRVIKDGITYYPWTLTGVDTNTKADNNKDPFERIDIPNPSGQYTIVVTHKGSLSAPQHYSLIVTGLQTSTQCLLTTPESITVNTITDVSANIVWGFVQGATYELDYRISGGQWVNLQFTNTVAFLTDLLPDTNYEVRVRATCNGQFSDYTSITFTTNKSCNNVIPTNLQASNITAVSATVSWVNNQQATYQLRFRPVGTSNYSNLSSTTTSVTLANLQSETNYEANVRAICPNGLASDWSEVLNFTTIEGCNAIPPSFCEFINITTTSAVAVWEEMSNASGYNIRWRPVGASTWSSVFNAFPTRSLTGLSSDTEYEVRIQTICETGSTSIFSQSFFFRTLGQNCIPVTPTNGQAINITTNSATVTWEGTAEQFMVSFGNTTSFITGNSYNLSNLSDNTTYTVSVRARCLVSGQVSNPLDINFTTQKIPCNPQTPMNGQAIDITTTSATIIWNGNSELYRVNYNGNNIITNNNYINLDGLQPATNYLVNIFGRCLTNEESNPLIVTFTTEQEVLPPSCTPTIPTGIQFTNITNNQFRVSWNLIPEATYVVRVSRQQGQPNWTEYPTMSNSILITGLEANTRYRVQIKSVCSDSESSWTGNFNVTTLRNNQMSFDYTEENQVIIQDNYVLANFDYKDIKIFDILGRLISETNYIPVNNQFVIIEIDGNIFKKIN
jgi:hypothetical protein